MSNPIVLGFETARSSPTTGIHYSGRHGRCRNRFRLRIITSRMIDARASIIAFRRRHLGNRDRDRVNDTQVKNRLSPASVPQTKADATRILATRAALRVRAGVGLKSATLRWIKNDLLIDPVGIGEMGSRNDRPSVLFTIDYRAFGMRGPSAVVRDPSGSAGRVCG